MERFNYSSHDADSDFQSSHWSSLQYVQGFTECAVFEQAKEVHDVARSTADRTLKAAPDGFDDQSAGPIVVEGTKTYEHGTGLLERQILAHDHGNRHCIEDSSPSLTQGHCRSALRRTCRRLGRSTPFLQVARPFIVHTMQILTSSQVIGRASNMSRASLSVRFSNRQRKSTTSPEVPQTGH